jgi:hypothetical protein
MIGLATGALLDASVNDVRSHLFVTRAENIATLVLSKSPFTEEQLRTLNDAVLDLGFRVLLAPNQPPESPLLAAITESNDLVALDRAADAPYLDLKVPTDNRPFFFNQLRFFDIPQVILGHLGLGVIAGNLLASLDLIVIMDPLDLGLTANSVGQAVEAVANDAINSFDPRRREDFGKLVCNSTHVVHRIA